MNVADMLSTGARRFGNKPALIAPDRTLSFNELDQLSTRLALHLRRLGIAPGDRVSLWLENGWRWMVAYYGIIRGTRLTPLPPKCACRCSRAYQFD